MADAAVFQSRITPSRSTSTTASPTAARTRAARPRRSDSSKSRALSIAAAACLASSSATARCDLVVGAARVGGGDESDRAEGLAARDERHGDVRAQLERPQDLELRLVGGKARKQVVRQLGNQDRPGLPNRDGGAFGSVPVERLRFELLDEDELERVDVDERQSLEPALDEHVDGAEVGDPRHCEPRCVLERPRVVERATEHPTGLGEEALAILGGAAVVDIGIRAEPAHDPAGLVAHRQRASEMPPPRPVARARDSELGLVGVAGGECLGPAREHQGDVVGVDHVVPARSQQLLRGAPEVLDHPLVDVVEIAARQSRPHLLRNRVAEEAVARLALALECGELLLAQELGLPAAARRSSARARRRPRPSCAARRDRTASGDSRRRRTRSP